MTNIVVLCNDDVWAVWTIEGSMPHIQDQREIRALVSETVKRLDPDCKDNYTVQFSNHLFCETWTELKIGIKELLEKSVEL